MADKVDISSFIIDYGFYISILIAIAYLIYFHPWDGKLDIYSMKWPISALIIPIIAGVAVFINNISRIRNDFMGYGDFYRFLVKNKASKRVLRLFKWSIYIGMAAFVSYTILCLFLLFTIIDKSIVSTYVAIPIFLISWSITEYIYSNLFSSDLTQFKSEYDEIQLLKNN